MNTYKKAISILSAGLFSVFVLVSGCGGEPTDDIEPVSGFEVERYLGSWYEIARLPNSFERGLSNVTATYLPREDGEISVINEGYDARRNRWKQANGRARFQGDADVGLFEVTFVAGFYLFGGDYKIFDLDKQDYQHALVTSNTRDTLWFLSRTPTVSEDLRQRYLDLGRDLGFAVDEWIFVDQGLNSE